MKFTLAQNQLAVLQEKNKLYSYLSASFTKTYFAVGEGKFSILFRGPKGAIKTVVDILATDKQQVFQIDYNKWQNAVSKLSFADEIHFNLTERSLKISMEGSTDSISLGIISFEDGSSEYETVTTFCEKQMATPLANEIVCTKEIADALTITNAMFSASGRNNAVAIYGSSVLYADRSIVLNVRMPEIHLSQAAVNLHKFSAGFMLQAMKFDSKFMFDKDYETLFWKDSNSMVVLASEECEIAIPSEEEVKQICPANGHHFSISSKELFAGLDFFNGFYEASAWKPITFNLGADGVGLHYKHPTTEISKKLETKSPVADGSFTIVSEMLSKLLSKAIDVRADETVSVDFTYDADSPGVACEMGDLYSIVFAKLTE